MLPYVLRISIKRLVYRALRCLPEVTKKLLVSRLSLAGLPVSHAVWILDNFSEVSHTKI